MRQRALQIDHRGAARFAIRLSAMWVLILLSALWMERRGMAAAEDPDVAVLAVVQSDGTSRAVNRPAGEAVVQRLGQIGERVRRKILDLKQCDLADDVCIVRAARAMGLRELICGEIQEQSGAHTYELKLRRLEVESGQELSSQQGRCMDCDSAALAARTAWLAGALYDRMTPLPELPKEAEVVKPPVAQAVQLAPAAPGTPEVTALRHHGWSPRKAALAGVFGTLALFGLVSGTAFAVLASHNDQLCALGDKGSMPACPAGGTGTTVGLSVGGFLLAGLSTGVFTWALYKRAE